ncbi:MAG: divergent polysaccharide deacetylase family protein [Rhodospirillales bacterium]|nr:divergent polysaccharide deacetylase family protein [Rhodospirillales bacterium]
MEPEIQGSNPPPRRGTSILALAWALLIAAIGGAVLWTHFATDAPTPAQVAAIRLAQMPAPAASVPALAPSSSSPTPADSAAVPPGVPPAPEAAPPALQPPGPSAMLRPPPATPRETKPRDAGPREAGPQPWVRFARPFDANDRRPRIAVVINDLGLSSAATDAAIQQLPADVTLAFSAYAEGLDHWVNLARAASHEVLINLPMEPTNFPVNDPGPQTLLTSLTPQQNLERLDWALARASGFVGVTNFMGSRFTASAEAMRPVLVALNERGFVFLDSRATPRSVAPRLAKEIGLPRAVSDRVIDQEASRLAIDARLAEIEKIARETGAAVATGYPYPVTFERLANWLPTLEGKGLVLAPITAVVNRQPDR